MWRCYYYAMTGPLGRTPAQFWAMTPRETAILYSEWGRMEGLKLKETARLIGISTASYSNGIDPFKDDKDLNPPAQPVVIDNDTAFAFL